MTTNSRSESISRIAGAAVAAALALAACAGSGDGAGGGDDDDDGSGGAHPDAGGPGPGPGDDPILPENLIDDLDDGDGSILPRGGRVGAWYTYNDKSPMGEQAPPAGLPFVPTPGGVTEAGYYANTTGRGFGVWGAGMGFDLNSTIQSKGTYDASAFQGIQFRAKGSGPVRAAVMIEDVISADVGGACQPNPMPGQGCDDGHGSVLLLTPEWTTYTLPFAQIKQAGWGKVVPFDATKIMSVQFNVDKNQVFDVSIDEIGFY
jgi:hypothetical protein